MRTNSVKVDDRQTAIEWYRDNIAIKPALFDDPLFVEDLLKSDNTMGQNMEDVWKQNTQ